MTEADFKLTGEMHRDRKGREFHKKQNGVTDLAAATIFLKKDKNGKRDFLNGRGGVFGVSSLDL
jgi:hypothetical protein